MFRRAFVLSALAALVGIFGENGSAIVIFVLAAAMGFLLLA
jgi:hypothetical protein